MDLEKYTQRQQYALRNPVEQSSGVFAALPAKYSKQRGKWRTSLSISYNVGCWLWIASASRQRGPGRQPYKLREWKDEWRRESADLIIPLLRGAGGRMMDALGMMQGAGVSIGDLRSYAIVRCLTPEEQALIAEDPS